MSCTHTVAHTQNILLLLLERRAEIICIVIFTIRKGKVKCGRQQDGADADAQQG